MLRQEIASRILAQHQILVLTFVAFGGIVAAGLQSEQSSPELLIYPILAVFLSAEWTRHTSGMFRAAQYIRDRFESPGYGLGWETWLAENVKHKTFLNRYTLSPGGIFLTTQFITIFLGVTDIEISTTNITLLCMDGLALAGTVLFIARHQ